MPDRKPANRSAKAAAVIAEQEKIRRRKAFGAYAAIAIALVLAIVVLVLLQKQFGTPDEVDPVGDHALVLGPEDAPRTVVVYEDFLCPFCGKLEAATGEELAALAADGKVRVEYRPFVLLASYGDYSERSLTVFAAVLLSSETDVATAFHQALFAEQPSESGSKPDNEALIGLAVEAGADEDAVRAALADGSAEAWADGATQDAEEAQVNKIGTPLVLLDGDIYQDGRTVEERGENLLAELD